MPRRSISGAGALLGLISLAACGASDTTTNTVESIDESTSRAATLVMACSGCHADGGTVIAPLSNYTEDLMREALTRYQTEADGTTVMHRLARGYSDADIALISTTFAASEDVE